MDMNLMGLILGLVGGLIVWMGLRADSSLVKVGGVAAIILAIVLQLNTTQSNPPIASGLPSQLNGSPLSAGPIPSPLTADSSKEKAAPKPSPSPKPSPKEDTGPNLTRKQARHIIRNNQSPEPSPKPSPPPTTPPPTTPPPTTPPPTTPPPTTPPPTTPPPESP